MLAETDITAAAGVARACAARVGAARGRAPVAVGAKAEPVEAVSVGGQHRASTVGAGAVRAVAGSNAAAARGPQGASFMLQSLSRPAKRTDFLADSRCSCGFPGLGCRAPFSVFALPGKEAKNN